MKITTKLEKNTLKELKKLKRHLKFHAVPLYKETKAILNIMNGFKEFNKETSMFSGGRFANYRVEVLVEMDLRYTSMCLNYVNESLFKNPTIHGVFKYGYNKYEYNVDKAFLPIFDKYEFSFDSLTATDVADKSLAQMLITSIMVELFTALRYTYPNKYRGVKLNEII